MRISDWSSDVCSSDLEDGAADSDNVLGDVVEALIGALYLEGGIEPACAFIRRAWEDRVHTHARAPQHPKSALQEWAAAHNRKPPAYEIVERAGPHHRSEEHTSELQSLMRISYAVFCLKNKKPQKN